MFYLRRIQRSYSFRFGYSEYVYRVSLVDGVRYYDDCDYYCDIRGWFYNFNVGMVIDQVRFGIYVNWDY